MQARAEMNWINVDASASQCIGEVTLRTGKGGRSYTCSTKGAAGRGRAQGSYSADGEARSRVAEHFERRCCSPSASRDSLARSRPP